VRSIGFTLCGLAAAGCVVAGVGTYPAAAILAGTGVAAVSANRAVTGDCWGSCHSGNVCERDSGLCVPRPCGGECRYDETCEMGRCVQKRREAVSRADFDAATDDEPARDE
jgi:hypothetical protein